MTMTVDTNNSFRLLSLSTTQNLHMQLDLWHGYKDLSPKLSIISQDTGY